MRRLVTAAAALAFLIAGCGGGNDKKSDSSSDTSAASTAQTTTQAQQSGGCEQVQQPAGKGAGDLKKPTDKLDPKKTYDLVFDTNCGKFTVELDQKLAPHTAASLVYLANQKFFDGLSFHRIVTGFVIQGGDPTGTGSGGPGYSTVDKPPNDAQYTKGVVAMAKTEAEPPGTSGSQFYIVTADDAGLPPDYAIVGKVVDGQDTVDKIGALGSNTQEGTPTQPVVMKTVTVEER